MIKCVDCGEEVSTYFLCDEGDGEERCGDCFDKTACGSGGHGEGCPTQVVEETAVVKFD